MMIMENGGDNEVQLRQKIQKPKNNWRAVRGDCSKTVLKMTPNTIVPAPKTLSLR